MCTQSAKPQTLTSITSLPEALVDIENSLPMTLFQFSDLEIQFVTGSFARGTETQVLTSWVGTRHGCTPVLV